MFRITVESHFSAMHSIRLHDGGTEPPHGHDWRVRVTFARKQLDPLGMVIDFAEAKKVLKQVTDQLDYRDLNEVSVLSGKNPTTEVVAEWILNRFLELGVGSIAQVELTEAPGCVAVVERT